MSPRPDPAAARAWAAAAALGLGVFIGACRLAPQAERIAGGPAAGGVAARLAGSTRVVLAERFYGAADLYLHKGVGALEAKAFSDPFQRVGAVLAPTRHAHAEGLEAAEIMPWLRFATALDPGNAEPWLVAAYWMERELARPDAAEGVYAEARRENPADYRIRAEWAKLKLRRHDAEACGRMLDTALRLWPAPLLADDEEARGDLRSLCELRGFLCAYQGGRARALELLRRAVALNPGGTLRADLAQLEGGADWTGNEALLRRLLRSVSPRPEAPGGEADAHCLRQGARGAPAVGGGQGKGDGG